MASAPFPESLNKEALYRVRGDLFANEIKSGPKEPLTVMVSHGELLTCGEPW